MKLFTQFLLVLLLARTVSAQNIEFEKANFPGRKDELREALKKLKLGIDYYEAGRKEFDDSRRSYLAEHKYFPVSVYDYYNAGGALLKSALAPLSDADKFNPNNTRVNYMLGFIWFNINPSGKEALQHFEKAFELGSMNTDSDLSFWLGWCYHLNANWDEAIKFYQFYLRLIQTKSRVNISLIEDVRKKIYECENGKSLSARPERVFIDNLGPNINTSSSEYGPAITADEQTIFFTSRRPGSTGGKRDESDNGFFEDIYSSTKVNGKWQPAKPLSKNVNTDGHDAAAGLSPDGSHLYVYKHTGSDGGDLYESVLFGLDWEEPIHMNKYINSRFHESSASLSFDGKHLFFVSDKDGGYGDRDIYVSDLDVNGEWGPARNLGAEINTKYGEDGVYMHPDGVTLYFSSKGHNSMGGYDIFKSTLVNGKWQTPVNMGYPINGPDDDVFYVVSGSGNKAYFASTKSDGYGEKDIYKITFLGPEKQPLLNTHDQLLSSISSPISHLKTESAIQVKSSRVTLLKGMVRDANTEKPLEASIDLIDNENGTLLATFKSNKVTGKYLVSLPSGHNYGVIVKANGYLFHSENIQLPEAAEFQEFVLDIDMNKVEVGSTVVLNNIFYDTDKATLKPESNYELNRLVKTLNDNKSIKIEIGSHTDNVGSDDYNLKLSESRSKAVVDYLVSKGISPARLVSVGYGETKPIASNDTEEGRKKNRRTEFRIVAK